MAHCSLIEQDVLQPVAGSFCNKHLRDPLSQYNPRLQGVNESQGAFNRAPLGEKIEDELSTPDEDGVPATHIYEELQTCPLGQGGAKASGYP